MTANRLMPLLALCMTLAFNMPSHATQVIGSVKATQGAVIATDALGKQRDLRRGRALFEGDKVETEDGGKVAIQFKDGTQFALGESSSFAVDEYVYGESQTEDKFSATIIKGTFRFITGLVAKNKPSAMSVSLGLTATIGVRGTNVAGELIGESATVILLDPGDGQTSAIEVFNEHGSVTIDEPSFGTKIVDRNSAPSPAQRMKLDVVTNIMRTIPAITRMRFYTP